MNQGAWGDLGCTGVYRDEVRMTRFVAACTGISWALLGWVSRAVPGDARGGLQGRTQQAPEGLGLAWRSEPPSSGLPRNPRSIWPGWACWDWATSSLRSPPARRRAPRARERTWTRKVWRWDGGAWVAEGLQGHSSCRREQNARRSAGSAGDTVVFPGPKPSVKGLPFSTLPNRIPRKLLINFALVPFNFL